MLAFCPATGNDLSPILKAHPAGHLKRHWTWTNVQKSPGSCSHCPSYDDASQRRGRQKLHSSGPEAVPHKHIHKNKREGKDPQQTGNRPCQWGDSHFPGEALTSVGVGAGELSSRPLPLAPCSAELSQAPSSCWGFIRRCRQALYSDTTAKGMENRAGGDRTQRVVCWSMPHL